MTHLPTAAHRRFAEQHGAASRQQLLDTGLSDRQIAWLVKRGDLVRFARLAYLSPSAAMTEHTRMAALCLARPEIAIAGPTAGRVWGIRKVTADRRLHIIAPPASNPSCDAGVVTYRSATLRPGDIVRRSDGINVTTRARTALDLNRYLGSDDALSAMEQLAHDGRLTSEDLRATASHISFKRRPWVRRFYELIDRRLDGGPAESDAEIRVGEALLRVGVVGLVRQHEMELTDQRFVRFDHAVPTLRWAIEVDLHPVHRETAGRSADVARDRAAAALGWTVDRVTAEDYRRRFGVRLAELDARFRMLQQRAGLADR